MSMERSPDGITDIPLTGKLLGETSKLDPTLEGKVRIEPITIGGTDFRTSFTEIVDKFGKTRDLTLGRIGEILEEVRNGSAQISEESQLLLSRLLERQINISIDALYMLRSPDFTTLPESQSSELVTGAVGDLVPNPKASYAAPEEIWTARDEKGLEPLHAETALHYLLQHGDKLQVGDWIVMSMETIADRHGYPGVFEVGRDGDGLWLRGIWTTPSGGWHPEDQMAFGLSQASA